MKWIADEAIKNYRQVSGYIPGRGVFFRDNAYARLMRADGGFGDGIGDDANGSIPADDGIRGGVGDEVERRSFLSTMLRVIFSFSYSMRCLRWGRWRGYLG